MDGRRADAHGLVGEQHVLEVGVGGGMHGDGLDAELAAGAQDAQRDLAAVGDDDLVEHGLALTAMMNSGWPNSTGSPFFTRIALTRAGMSDSIWFIIFMASMMHSIWPTLTSSPISTKVLAPGEGAA